MSLKKNIINNMELTKLRVNCNYGHKHCYETVISCNNIFNKVNQDYFDKFLMMIKGSNYNSCVSSYSNNKSNEIKKFIIKCSLTFEIKIWDSIIQFFEDDEIIIIFKNQIKLNNNYINKIVNEEINTTYGNKVNLINSLLSQPIKIKTFDFIISLMDINLFMEYIKKMTKHQNQIQVDNVIVKYINENKNIFNNKENKTYCINVINTFINKPIIIKNIYQLISSFLETEFKLEIFNKSISLLDKELSFLILENKDIIPDISTINKLVEKCYVKPNGCINANQIAEIIDLLCEYNLKIDKSIILKLLDHGCYINNIEKYNIKIDNEILEKCSNLSYYPYKFDIIPGINILKKECSKSDNINIIKKLKEYGGTYTVECLEEACKIKKNSKTIKFLIEECDIKVSDICLKNYQETYGIDSLDLIMKNYKITKPENNDELFKPVEIDIAATMTVIPKENIINNNDDLAEYKIKGKIKKFFNYKNNNIKYLDLYQLILKYLITNKLVIGNYFIINENMSKLLKINNCIIMHIDQIHNILTYFINDKN